MGWLLAALVVIGLAGCADLQGFIDALPEPTPQEQCDMQGGHWREITTYDAQGKPSTSQSCIVDEHPRHDEHPRR